MSSAVGLVNQTLEPSWVHDLMREVYDNDAAALGRYAYRLTSDRARAEDVVQETLLRAWKHLQSTGGEQPRRAWLFTVARNIVIDESRTARFRNEVNSPVIPDVADRAAPDDVNTALDRMLIAEALTRLPAAHRAVLVRAYYLGWTSTRIADDLGVAEGTVKSRLHYATRKARLILAEMGVTR